MIPLNINLHITNNEYGQHPAAKNYGSEAVNGVDLLALPFDPDKSLERNFISKHPKLFWPAPFLPAPQNKSCGEASMSTAPSVDFSSIRSSGSDENLAYKAFSITITFADSQSGRTCIHHLMWHTLNQTTNAKP